MHRSLCYIVMSLWLFCCPVSAQEDIPTLEQSMQQTSGRLDQFTRKSQRRTQKALRRFERYEKKIQKTNTSKQAAIPDIQPGKTDLLNQESLQGGLGKEPTLDSLRTAYGFVASNLTVPGAPLPAATLHSIDQAQQQLNVTQHMKTELQQRKNHWKNQLKEHPEYARTVGKMEKESYYYTAQINQYRKTIHDPTSLEETLLQTLQKDPRWSDYLATLPRRPSDPEKMQPKQLVQEMMQSQAAAIDPDAMKLIQDAKKKSTELLGELGESATSIGNLDNATQVPSFTPNPYKTKSFWEHIDVGFNLEFDRKTYDLPSSGVVGLQLSYNFSQRISLGVMGTYRFGMGDIKHIRFSHQGAGYGAFANYIVWKGFGIQAGFERNWRTAVNTGEGQQSFDAGWTSSALLGISKEYHIGRKVKGTVAVFYDFLYQRHSPRTNAIVWRMGWKF